MPVIFNPPSLREMATLRITKDPVLNQQAHALWPCGKIANDLCNLKTNVDYQVVHAYNAKNDIISLGMPFAGFQCDVQAIRHFPICVVGGSYHLSTERLSPIHYAHEALGEHHFYNQSPFANPHRQINEEYFNENYPFTTLLIAPHNFAQKPMNVRIHFESDDSLKGNTAIARDYYAYKELGKFFYDSPVVLLTHQEHQDVLKGYTDNIRNLQRFNGPFDLAAELSVQKLAIIGNIVNETELSEHDWHCLGFVHHDYSRANPNITVTSYQQNETVPIALEDLTYTTMYYERGVPVITIEE